MSSVHTSKVSHREFTRRFASAATIGGQPATVGVTVLSDATNRSGHEVDVVAAGHASEGAAIVMAIGEAKYTVSRRTLAGLAGLEHIRALIARKHPSAASARLLLFSGTGSNATSIRKASRRDVVELIDLDRLHTGTGPARKWLPPRPARSAACPLLSRR